MPANKSSLKVYYMGRFNSKVVFQKCMFFTNIGIDYPLKAKQNYCQLCIDYESNKYILTIFLKEKS